MKGNSPISKVPKWTLSVASGRMPVCPSSVRTCEHCDILVLDKKSFRDLDKSTINIISENARYNAACTKEPSQRTRDDLQILQQRTAHLSHLSKLSFEVHMELCRVMRYRKVNERSMLVPMAYWLFSMM